jgi:hypothetical protein
MTYTEYNMDESNEVYWTSWPTVYRRPFLREEGKPVSMTSMFIPLLMHKVFPGVNQNIGDSNDELHSSCLCHQFWPFLWHARMHVV